MTSTPKPMVSENKAKAIYAAIEQPIMDLGIRLERGEGGDLDVALFKLTDTIWREVAKELRVTP